MRYFKGETIFTGETRLAILGHESLSLKGAGGPWEEITEKQYEKLAEKTQKAGDKYLLAVESGKIKMGETL